jgi:hypothetical protein
VRHSAFFAKAGRVDPRIADIVLQHPSEWTQLLEAGKDLDPDHIDSLTIIVHRTGGVAKTLALLHVIRAATRQAQAAETKNSTELRTLPLGGMPATLSAIASIQEQSPQTFPKIPNFVLNGEETESTSHKSSWSRQHSSERYRSPEPGRKDRMRASSSQTDSRRTLDD